MGAAMSEAEDRPPTNAIESRLVGRTHGTRGGVHAACWVVLQVIGERQFWRICVATIRPDRRNHFIDVPIEMASELVPLLAAAVAQARDLNRGDLK